MMREPKRKIWNSGTVACGVLALIALIGTAVALVPRADAQADTDAATCVLETDGNGPEVADADLNVEVIVDGLEVPWGLALLGDGDMLVTERPGRLRLIQDGVLVPEPILEPAVDVPPPLFGIDAFGAEGGLLGLELHPFFELNRQFYVFYNNEPEPDAYSGRLERYVLSEDRRSAVLNRVILEDLPAGLHHQGGRMHIGPDGMLYVGVGAYDPPDAQDPDSLAGKLLRVDLDGNIPPDNPDPTSPVFISGIRNTQGFDWLDDDTLAIVDHGPSGIELGRPTLRGLDEVNVARAGDNLGWPRIWGCDEEAGLVTPSLSWTSAVPPTGAMLYRDGDITAWEDRFLFTSVGRATGRHIHAVSFDPANPDQVLSHEAYLVDEFGRLRTIVSDGDGGVYVMTSNCDGRGDCPPEGDVILHITSSEEAAPVLGDVNCDDTANIVDALFVAQYAVGVRTDNGPCPIAGTGTLVLAQADRDRSGDVSITDAFVIALCSVGANLPICR